MPEEDFDLPIDGDYDAVTPAAPKRRTTATRKKTTKGSSTRATTAAAPRRRAAASAAEESEVDERYLKTRPKISIDATIRAPKKVNLYRRLATAFTGATVFVVAIIVFFTLQSATITLHEQAIPVSASLPIQIVDSSSTATSTNALAGLVVTVTTSTTQIYKPTATVDKPGKSHGTITITNNGAAKQSLVATTRFLSESGILFRAVSDVSIPAHGTADVEVAADKTGPTGDVGPSKFSIPGLNAAAQKLVFGVSADGMIGGSGKVGVVSQADIDKAEEDARKALLEIGQTQLTSVTVPDGDNVLYTTVNITAQSSAKAGDEVSEFKIITSGTMAYVAYPKDTVFAAADREVQSKSPTQYHKILFVNDVPTVSLQGIDVAKKIATLQVYREGSAVLDSHATALQPNMFAGQTREQIETQLKSINGVTGVDVTFFPPWISTTPHVASRIDVKLDLATTAQ
ncbi:MAG: hypothetical protein NT003_02900 [Candidatus Magasanikbacteria bacterium]|nr:hypothetical protein [Candidatus Magasanikbacteria bacterium]